MSERVVVDRLPWIAQDRDVGSTQDETWMLDVENLHVWVKHYKEGSMWGGWRVGRGGSPLDTSASPYPDRESAMKAAVRVAHITAVEQVERAAEKLNEAHRALREVIVTL